MQELPLIKKMAYWIFYGYKFAGILAIPMITLLFMTSTANLLVTGRLNVFGVDIAWAIVYAVCFEMNGLRIVIDATTEALNKKAWSAVIDYGLGILLLSLGAVATFIESLVNTNAIEWSSVVNSIWIVFLVRTVVIVLVCVRECVHYAPLLMKRTDSEQVTELANQTTNVNVQIANILPNQPVCEPEVTEQSLQTVTELVRIPEKSSVRGNKKQTIIELFELEPNLANSEIVRRTGCSKSYVSNVLKELR